MIHTFPTEQGNVVGNPIVQVIKISGNPRTLRTLSEHIDVEVTGVLAIDKTIDEAGDSLIKMITLSECKHSPVVQRKAELIWRYSWQTPEPLRSPSLNT